MLTLSNPSARLRQIFQEDGDTWFPQLGLVAGLGLSAGFDFFALFDKPWLLPVTVLVGGAWGYVVGRLLAKVERLIQRKYF